MAVKHLRLVKEFKKQCTMGRVKPSRGRYFVQYKNGRTTYANDRACYSGVDWENARKISILQDGVIPFLITQGWTEGEVIEHYRWLIQESPFAKFLNKDPVWCLENGFPLLCTGNKTTMLFAATVLNIWEHAHGKHNYIALIREGCNPFIALVGCYSVALNRAGNMSFNSYGYNDGHTPFHESALTEHILRNMLTERYLTIGYAQKMYGNDSVNARAVIKKGLPKAKGQLPSIFPQLNTEKADEAYSVKDIATAFNKYLSDIIVRLEDELMEKKHAA